MHLIIVRFRSYNFWSKVFIINYSIMTSLILLNRYKVLYEPINSFMENASPAIPQSSTPMVGRILDILKAVRRLADDIMLHQEVANQLMVYLLFFVSTTLFNRVISKGKWYSFDKFTLLKVLLYEISIY